MKRKFIFEEDLLNTLCTNRKFVFKTSEYIDKLIRMMVTMRKGFICILIRSSGSRYRVDKTKKNIYWVVLIRKLHALYLFCCWNSMRQLKQPNTQCGMLGCLNARGTPTSYIGSIIKT